MALVIYGRNDDVEEQEEMTDKNKSAHSSGDQNEAENVAMEGTGNKKTFQMVLKIWIMKCLKMLKNICQSHKLRQGNRERTVVDEGDGDTNYSQCTWNVFRRLRRKIGGYGKQIKNLDHPTRMQREVVET